MSKKLVKYLIAAAIVYAICFAVGAFGFNLIWEKNVFVAAFFTIMGVTCYAMWKE
ncbi:MAG: hypothetical protein WA821_10575 [Anaerolineales bacterium]